MKELETIAVASLGLIGLCISLSNWVTLFRSRPDKHVSPVPLLGGGLLAFGLIGFELTRPYWWIAACVDFGTLGLLIALPSLVYQLWEHSNRNVRHQFTHIDGDRTVNIKLFNNGNAAIQVSFDPPRPIGNRGSLAESRTCAGRWADNGDLFDISNYAGGRDLRMEPSDGGFTLIETCPDRDEPSIYDLNGICVEKTV